MTAQAAPTRPAVRTQGPLSGLATLPFRLLGLLCGSLLLSVLVEWLGMHFFWPQQSWHHAEHMMQFELDQLSLHFRQSLLLERPERTAHELVEWTYDHVLAGTAVTSWAEKMGTNTAPEPGHGTDRFRRLFVKAYTDLKPYVLAAGYSLITVIVRALVLSLTLPLFVAAAFVGLVDGLARRDIRRFGAGRESGFLYHRARASLLPLAVLPWVAYLALPVSLNALWILLPSAVLLSIAVNLTAASFKKYL